MPDWTPTLLLLVFVSHLPFFAWRWRRTRELRYAATSLTFALLSVLYALQVLAPDWSWGGVPLYRLVRLPALACAALSIGMLLHHHLARLRSRSASAKPGETR